MLTEPLSITINSVPFTLPRISQIADKVRVEGVYSNTDETLSARVSHTRSGSFLKHLVLFEQRKIVTNPLDSTNDYGSLTCSVQFVRPDYGFTVTDMQNFKTGVFAWFTNPIVAQLFGREA